MSILKILNKVNTEKNVKSGKASRASNSKHSATNTNRRDSIKSRATTSMTKVTTPEEIIEDESSDDEGEIELYFKVDCDTF